MKKIVVLGSTGTIGRNTLKVLKEYPDKFEVIGLSAHSNVDLLLKQIRDFKPKYVCITDPSKYKVLQDVLGLEKNGLTILSPDQGLVELSTLKEADLILVGLIGNVGLEPIVAALEAKKNLAIANKEPLVMAGSLIMNLAKKNGCNVLPVDSEHSAIFQCIEHQQKSSLESIYLTASGGPLHDVAKEDFDTVTVNHITTHPRWKMGKKISIDSATLMNKGFEAIEAKVLFDMPMERIKVIVHPEAVLHSFVEFVNGSYLAQMSVCDMCIPIQYALTYPEKISMNSERLDLVKLGKLHFYEPDLNKFPCLQLAYEAGKKGGSAPCVLSVADEELVELFLKNKVKLSQFPLVIEKVLSQHKWQENFSLNQIKEYSQLTREQVRRICN